MRTGQWWSGRRQGLVGGEVMWLLTEGHLVWSVLLRLSTWRHFKPSSAPFLAMTLRQASTECAS